ncbi:hypothetical protein CREGCYN_16750 (plasmid) [Synechococcus sp. M16CYN]
MHQLIFIFMAVNLLLINISPAVASWICDGEELTAERFSGAVDVTGIAGGIPNSSELESRKAT